MNIILYHEACVKHKLSRLGPRLLAARGRQCAVAASTCLDHTGEDDPTAQADTHVLQM